jgi:hypothetical protein
MHEISLEQGESSAIYVDGYSIQKLAKNVTLPFSAVLCGCIFTIKRCISDWSIVIDSKDRIVSNSRIFKCDLSIAARSVCLKTFADRN